MKTAACIALLALAASACSKNDNTQTPDGMTTSPSTETQTQMPVETAAPNEIAPVDPSMQGASGMPGASNGGATASGNAASGTSAPGNGVTDGSSTVWSNGGGPTAGNKVPSEGNPGSTALAPPSRPDADNTRVNERDRGPSTTPLDQGNNDTDLKITQKIRQAVMGDGGLSFTAKNVKIITNKGTVVLRGPVKSDDERARIDSAAKTVAGSSNVINEIEIKK